MTSRFVDMMPFIFRWEGCYDNDPDDPGGETKYGIDKRSHPDVDIKALTKEGATAIYWRDYWSRYGCEAHSKPLGEVFFNATVNCGNARARSLLGESNGKASTFLVAQEAFYKRLADQKPALRKYLKGWLNRTGDLRTFLRIS